MEKKLEKNYFYKGYSGKNIINLKIMAYYRFERIIVDIVEFYEQIFKQNATEENQKTIIDIVKSMFDKNEVIDMAFSIDNEAKYVA